MMTEAEMIQMAREEGFTKAAVLPVEKLTFIHSLRACCEANECGNYGRNYACPPDCGTPQQMEERVRKYKKALILQTIQPVDDIMDSAQTKEAKKFHNMISWALVERLQNQGIVGLPVMAGPCSACSVCAKIEGKPCRFPQKIASCLSAYSIHAADMAAQCGMEYWCGMDRVAFFSIYLFD
ncbi:MAG: DUF2284 domain-containing protein [Eubacteriales bacterium]|nr:DUF2284 domain-containing protein [Eubacteriales bacterium]